MWESRSDFQGGGETRRVLPSPSFPPPFPPPASFFFEARRPQLLKEFALGLGHDLPLRDLIDGVDVIHTFGPRLIALVHGVDPQIAGLALRIGPPPLANRYRRELGFAVVETAFAVAWLLPQVVQVGHRDRGQPLVFALAVLLIRALQNAPRGRSAQGLVRLIDDGQQLHVGAGIALRKAMPWVRDGLDFSVVPRAGDQPRHLGPAPAGHLPQVAPQQTARRAALFLVLLLAQNLLHPAVNLLTIFAFEPDCFAGF